MILGLVLDLYLLLVNYFHSCGIYISIISIIEAARSINIQSIFISATFVR